MHHRKFPVRVAFPSLTWYINSNYKRLPINSNANLLLNLELLSILTLFSASWAMPQYLVLFYINWIKIGLFHYEKIKLFDFNGENSYCEINRSFVSFKVLQTGSFIFYIPSIIYCLLLSACFYNIKSTPDGADYLNNARRWISKTPLYNT